MTHSLGSASFLHQFLASVCQLASFLRLRQVDRHASSLIRNLHLSVGTTWTF